MSPIFGYLISICGYLSAVFDSFYDFIYYKNIESFG